MTNNRYLVAFLSGPDKDTPPSSFQNVTMYYPSIIGSVNELNLDDIVTRYKQSGLASDMTDAFIVLDIRPDARISNDNITMTFGNKFTYEKVLYIACQPNSLLTGRIQIYTSDDKLTLDALKVPCVSTEHTTYKWTATLDI